MTAHSLLGPSAAERWLQCPASVDMASRIVAIEGDRETTYSREGNDAHRMAELIAGVRVGLISTDESIERMDQWEASVPAEFHFDMTRYAALYAEYIAELLGQHEGHDFKVLLEQRLDTGVPYCWGTGDCIFLCRTCGHVHVIDYKYGVGIPVYAEENPQLKLYGLGALDTLELIDDVNQIHLHIFQPRLGSISTWTTTPDDLRQWRTDVVIPAAIEALGERPRFRPSEVACRFCPAAGECKPRLLHVTRRDFGDPDMLTPDEIAEALETIGQIRDWCNAVEALALDKMYSGGVEIPRHKVVLSGGRRTIPDVEAAVQVLIDNGFDAEQIVRIGIRPFYELERIVGKKELAAILGDLIVTSTGKPAIVSETDKRAAIDPASEARKAFS